MIDRIIDTEDKRQLLITFIADQKLPFTASIKDGRLRSVDQNRLQWLWASETSMQRQDMTPRQVQNEWKHMFGVPILCAENEPFAIMWAKVSKWLPYEEQLELMYVIQVSSIMTVSQAKRYFDEIEQYNLDKGIELSSPEEILFGPKIGARMARRIAEHTATGNGEAAHRPAPKRKVR